MVPSLPPSDRRAAEVISELAEGTLDRSVTQIAEAASVAESTVIRACKRMGFSGFQDLKLAIARDGLPRMGMVADEIDEGDSLPTVVAKLFASSSAVLADASTSVDTDALAVIVSAIAHADRVLIVGFGPSSSIAQDAAYRFRCIGVRTDAPVDLLTQHLSAGLLRRGDVCLAISHTGATRETLDVVEAARDVGAFTATVTSYAQSPLTRVVDRAVVAGGKQIGFRVEAMASRFAHLCVLDAIYVAVAMQDEDKALAALRSHHSIASKHQL